MTEEEIESFIESYNEKKTTTDFPTHKTEKYIHCHLCKSERIEFVAEYHKAVFLRILASVAVLFIAIFTISTISDLFHLKEDLNTIPLIISIVLYLLLKGIISSVESRTHVKAICRDCGNVWILQNS